jgi:hypothetical protein
MINLCTSKQGKAERLYQSYWIGALGACYSQNHLNYIYILSTWLLTLYSDYLQEYLNPRKLQSKLWTRGENQNDKGNYFYGSIDKIKEITNASSENDHIIPVRMDP